MTAAKKLPALTETTEPNMMQVIADAARDPAVDATKMEKLWELYERTEHNIDRRLFFSNMNKVQAAISQIATDAGNPQTNSRYATFAALDKALRPHYTEHGFVVQFDEEPSPRGAEWTRVVCIVSRGAHETRSHKDIPIETTGAKGGQVMTKIHASGSSLSYGKRYTYGMAFNIAVERDDDGNAAGTKTLSPSMLDELMDIVKDRKIDTTIFCPWASERLGYQIENLSMVSRRDMNRVKTWLMAKKKETGE